MPKYPFVARVNYKPLAVGALSSIHPEKVLKSLQKEVFKAMKARIELAAFSARAKQALRNGLEIKIGPNSITLIATHPAFFPLLKGQARGQMTWLQKARRPIPIITDDGEVIFRTATAKSMRNGGWMHPGHKSTRIIEEAKKEAREIIKKRIQKEIRKQLRSAMRKSK